MIENIFNGENHTIDVPDTLQLVPGDNPNIDMPHTPGAMYIAGVEYPHASNDFINDGQYRIDYDINGQTIRGFSFVRQGGGLGTTVRYARA